MSDLVLVEREGPIATVVLNRPEKLNALNHDLSQGLFDALGPPIATTPSARWC